MISASGVRRHEAEHLPVVPAEMPVEHVGIALVDDAPVGHLDPAPLLSQPGMPAEIIIKTGERSVLTYMLHPLTKRLAASMKEE